MNMILLQYQGVSKDLLLPAIQHLAWTAAAEIHHSSTIVTEDHDTKNKPDNYVMVIL